MEIKTTQNLLINQAMVQAEFGVAAANLEDIRETAVKIGNIAQKNLDAIADLENGLANLDELLRRI